MSLIKDVRDGLQHLNQSLREMKKFAVTMAVVLGLLAALVFIFGDTPRRAFWLGGIAAAFLLIGFLAPKILRPIHSLWMGLALVLGYFMSRLLLTLLFFLVITPIGLVMRLLGKDLLDEKIEPDKKSYWKKREQKSTDADRYERLY